MFSGGKEALMTFVETKIEELIEESQMTPEQLELKHYRRQVEQMNRRQQEAQKAQEEARRQQAAMQQQETFARALETELKNHNIPSDTRYRRDVDRFVDERLMHVVQEQQRRLAPSDLQMAVEAAAEYFGPLLAAERTARQEEAKAKRGAKPKAPPLPKRGAPRRGKAPKAPKMDTRTYFEKIAEEAGEW